MIKLLLDQGLPRTAASLLRDEGFDVIHVGEIGMATAEDAQILQKAQEERRVVITLDADFHALLALTGASSPSVVRIRIEGLRGGAAADLLKIVFLQAAEDLEQGAVITVQEGRMRVRRLPLTSRMN